MQRLQLLMDTVYAGFHWHDQPWRNVGAHQHCCYPSICLRIEPLPVLCRNQTDGGPVFRVHAVLDADLTLNSRYLQVMELGLVGDPY